MVYRSPQLCAAHFAAPKQACAASKHGSAARKQACAAPKQACAASKHGSAAPKRSTHAKLPYGGLARGQNRSHPLKRRHHKITQQPPDALGPLEEEREGSLCRDMSSSSAPIASASSRSNSNLDARVGIRSSISISVEPAMGLSGLLSGILSGIYEWHLQQHRSIVNGILRVG